MTAVVRLCYKSMNAKEEVFRLKCQKGGRAGLTSNQLDTCRSETS